MQTVRPVLTLAVAVVLAVIPFARASTTPVAPEGPVPLAIVVYDQPSFKGQSLRIEQAVPDLAVLKFDNKAASFEIQGTGDWMLCENRNYGGRCVRGSAKADDLRVLQLFGRVSSLYPVPAAAAPTTPTATPVPRDQKPTP